MADIAAPASAAPAAPSQDTSVSAEDSNSSSQQSAPAEGQAADLQAIQNDPNAPVAVKKEAAKRLKALKLKIDGREVEEQLPFDIPDTAEAREYMTRQLQMSKAAQKRMGEKAALEQQVSSFLEELRKNPRKVLSDPAFGVDIKNLAAQVIEEEIANSQKSPEQLAREKLEKELTDLKDQRKREQDEQQKKEFQRMQEAEYERYDNLIDQALTNSDLPKSSYVIKKMADYLMLGVSNGINVTPQDVLPLIREEILDDIRQMSQAMPIETLEKLFGGDILTKIRKKNVAKAKSQPITQAKAAIKDIGATKAEKKEEGKKQTFKDFFGV